MFKEHAALEKPSYEELEERIRELEEDASDYKRQLEKQKESELELRISFENAPIVMLLLDSERRITRMNSAAVAMTKCSKGDATGLRMGEVLRCIEAPEPKGPVCDNCGVRSTILKTFQTGASVRRVEASMPHGHQKRKSDMTVLVSTMPIDFMDEKRVAVYLEDITDQKQWEASLKESEKRFRDITEKANDWVWEFDQHGVYTYSNKKVKDLLGYSPEEVVGKTPLDFMPPEEAERVDKLFGEIVRAHRPFDNRENINVHKDGREVVLETSALPFYDTDGKISGYRGIDRDITERKRVEASLRLSEEKFRHMFEAMNDGVVVYEAVDNGRDFIISDLNAAGERIDNVKKEAVIGKRLTAAFPCVKEFGLMDVLKRVWQTGQAEHFSGNIYSDERVVTGWRENFVYRLSSGEVVAVFEDVSERKLNEAALKESEKRFRDLAELLPETIFEMDLGGKFTYVNCNAKKQFQYTEADYGRGLNAYETTAPEDHQKLFVNVQKILNGHVIGLNEYTALRKDGSTFSCLANSVAIFKEGKPAGIRGILIDISEREQIMKELRKSRDELEKRVVERTAELEKRAEQLSRLSSKLTLTEQRERDRIASVLHDHLQQLMAAANIRQNVLIANLEYGLKPEAQKVRELIEKSINVSRSLSAELSMPILRFGDLTGALRWLSGWMKENYGLEVIVHSRDRIVLKRKDIALLVFQSVRELLFNVQKHSGVTSATVMMKKLKGELRITVSDRGEGFYPETIGAQPDCEQKFGLFSIQERLVFLGGRFEINSIPNEGTNMILVIPVDEKKVSDTLPWELTDETHGKKHSAPVGRRSGEEKIQVMLVDDHPAMRQGMSRILMSFSDIEVAGEARDGEEAVRLARKILPDVILMDVNIPKMDGVEATRIIHSELPHIDIIAFSINDSPEQVKKMIDAGATAYYRKNDDIDQLIAEIRGQ